MIRPVLIVVGLAALLGAIAQPAAAATLKSAVTVTAENVRLGDIFDDLDGATDGVIGRAPAPGRKQTLGPRRLKSIAHAHGLEWNPIGRQARVVITRAGRLIDMDEIEIALRRALSRNGLSKDHKIEIFNREIRVMAPVGAKEPYEIGNVRFDTGTGRFNASLIVSDNDEILKIVGLNGRAYTVVEIPVLTRQMRSGDVIERSDIEWIAVRADEVNRNAVLDIDEIIGQSPRRQLPAGVPIRRNEIRPPIVVAQGSIVTLELRTEKMTLIARVQATENGATGPTIRVRNTRSKRTVEGVVVGPGRVVVPHIKHNEPLTPGS
jgi:flagella basal body P-ring formation protein FlgA